uniref:Protein RADIALIS-like 4 isoform X1 n=1 Tax=Cymbidium ensifolium TaxID=78740 RepID=A0A515HGI6_CYMEN|nr:protein RADIALIS-like 4 isoform X1 [Cymbidium ensifolium]
MASSYATASKWSAKEDKEFERALAMFGEHTPNRWEKVAAAIGGGKTVTDVRLHYQLLLDDIDSIESGLVPFPNYRIHSAQPTAAASAAAASFLKDDRQRGLVHLKLR